MYKKVTTKKPMRSFTLDTRTTDYIWSLKDRMECNRNQTHEMNISTERRNTVCQQ